MKHWTIVRRLNTTLGLLIGLSLLGILLLFGLEKRVSQVRAEASHAYLIAQQLRYDVVLLRAATRGLLLDPKNAVERQRRSDAHADLTRTCMEGKAEFASYPELADALAAINDYDTQTVEPLRGQMSLLLDNDLPSAVRYRSYALKARVCCRMKLVTAVSTR